MPSVSQSPESMGMAVVCAGGAYAAVVKAGTTRDNATRAAITLVAVVCKALARPVGLEVRLMARAARILNGVRDGCVQFTNRAFDVYVRAVYHRVPFEDDKGGVVEYERERAVSRGGRASSDPQSEIEKVPARQEPDGSSRGGHWNPPSR